MINDKRIPKVSIIVPIYNVEKYLERCLDSLINQTLKEIEIILIDDGSPDSCPIICDEYVKKDERIIVIHKKNAGLGMARNSGLEIAKGEYIAFVDSDDYVDYNYYEKLYNNAKENNSDFTLGGYKIIDEKLNIKSYNDIYLYKTVYIDDEIKENIFFNMLGISKKNNIGVSVWRAIYKREVLEKYKIKFVSEREYLSEDYIFHIDFVPKCKKISIVKGSYYNYCENNISSLTRKYRFDRFDVSKKLYEEVARRIKKIGCYEKLKLAINNAFIVNVRASIKQEKFNPKIEAKENIKKMCYDELTKKCINSGYEQSIKQRIFDTLIKLKAYEILYCIIK